MAKTLRKFLCVFTVSLLTLFVFIHPASSDELANREIPFNQYGIRSTNPFVVDRFIENGREIEAVIVPGPPHPPAGSVRAEVANLPVPDIAAGTNTISNVPAMTWVFGCSATSAAMMFGHYDNAGFPNMYAGPTNGGVFPMTNEVWGTVVINGETRALCPLSATRDGLDGRAIRGHVDDYWIQVNNAGPDPFITGGWSEHTPGECTGDYMGTSQSSLGNIDGGTTFYNNTDNSPLYDYVAPAGRRDGCYGMKRFAESRGYTVQSYGNFNQRIAGYDGKAAGFTYENFKAEIDAGRPVLIQVVGHTMLGYGYNDPSTIYIHDTWDYLDHSMTWGGEYSGMQHTGVTVLRLAPQSCTYTISPRSDGFASTSALGVVTVTPSSSSCYWTAASNASWASIISGSSGTGTGTVAYSISYNTSGSHRTGDMTIGGQTVTIRQAKSVFLDDPNNVFSPYIYSIYTENITVGCGNNYYCPANNVTRGEMAAFIMRAEYGENFSYTTTPYFSDVPSYSSFFKYVQKMKDTGVTAVSGTYGVNNNVTRQEMAAFIIRARYGESFAYTLTPYFTDVPSTNVFFKYVQKMKDERITANTGTYGATNNVTRAEMAAFLGRAFLGMQ